MQNVYTMEKFKEIQKELTNKIYCELIDVQDEVQDEIQVKRYDVQQEIFYYRLQIEDGEETPPEECATASADEETIDNVNNLVAEEIEGEEIEKNPKTEKVMKHVIFKVWFQNDGCKVKCSCCRFEFRGILCTHAIFVLLRNNMTSIPECYILRIWRKDVSLAHTKVPLSSDSWDLSPDQRRYKELCDDFAELADVVSKNDDKCNDIKKWIGEQLKAINDEVPSASKEVVSSEIDEVNEGIKVNDPNVVPTKGRPCKNRLKSKVYAKKAKKGKENIEVLQEVPTQQSLAGTFQAETVNFTREQYNQLLIHRGGLLANNVDMLGVPHVSPYGHVVNVTPAYGAPQQWDYGRYGTTYGGFQLHGRAYDGN
ncbi:hypothetical protein MKX03_019477 [Papaver bracteatum]|nr:hypothetical protein MKX03_019477 [Papaver bracteatum]